MILFVSSCTEDDNFFFCTLDSDCPIGFECVNSYCVEKVAGTPDSVTKQDENTLPQNDNTPIQDEDSTQKVDNDPDTTTQKDEEQVQDETTPDVDNPIIPDEDNPETTDETQDEDIVVPPGCGNSVVDNGEKCEIDDTRNCTAFPTNGFASGTATCKPDCTDWDLSTCVCPLGTEQNGDGKCEVLCGNGSVDGDEACEPTDTKECTTFADSGFESGSATCESDCTAWIKSSCVCPGDLVIDSEGKCVENDECTLETDNCDDNATCSNTVDSFTCACNDYYDGDGVTCTYCDQDATCGSDCTQCDVATPKCKDNSGTTTCVECLTNDDCTDPQTCNTTTNLCVDEYCGDGIKNGTEECDDGDSDDGDGCKNNCTIGSCSHNLYMSSSDFDTDVVYADGYDRTTGAHILDGYGWTINENFTVIHGNSIEIVFDCWDGWSCTEDFDYTLKNRHGTTIKTDYGAGFPSDYTFTASCD